MLARTLESSRRGPWNKGKLVWQKSPLKLKEIWAIRVRLELADRKRELALFNWAIDSKLRDCDLVQLRVRDVAHGSSRFRYRMRRTSSMVGGVPCVECPDGTTSSDSTGSMCALLYSTTPSLPCSGGASPFTGMMELT